MKPSVQHVVAALAVLACAVALVVGGFAGFGELAHMSRPPDNHSFGGASSQGSSQDQQHHAGDVDTSGLEAFALDQVPAYSGEPSVQVNGNVPFFQIGNDSSESVETYSPLDALGRCSTAVALVGEDIMPTEPRGSIGSVKPSGWVNGKYDFVDGKYLYNRCHLIAYQLSGENANECNLITGTRSMNKVGMLPYENKVASYVHATGNHVYYRVTPVFEGRDLVARGVLMEAESVEDWGSGLRFCVWCYNVEPGVEIDYETGENRAQ